jgi:hypothetical protein
MTLTCCKHLSAERHPAKVSSSDVSAPNSFRWSQLFSGLFSALGLILMPKCPLCLAAYFSLLTGISLSFSTAYYLRLSLMILCAGALAFIAFKLIITRFNLSSRQIRQPQPNTISVSTYQE